MIKHFTLFFIGIVFLAGCNIINPSEPTPTYIHIDSFHFVNSNPTTYGSSSHNINTVFAIYNGIQIGVYSLPCTFPIITTPGAQLILQPGIPINGFNDQEGAYPFYSQAIDTLVPQPGKIVNYTPTTGYLSNTKILFMDAFELNSGSQFTKDSVSGVNIITVNSDSAFEGTGSGLMNFTKNDSASVYTQYMVLPTGKSVFCELNYKSNIPIAIGLVAISKSTGNISVQYNNIAFAPTAHWTKIYLSLTEIISSFPADDYSLIIKGAVPYGQANGYAQFDNIKLVTSQ